MRGSHKHVCFKLTHKNRQFFSPHQTPGSSNKTTPNRGANKTRASLNVRELDTGHRDAVTPAQCQPCAEGKVPGAARRPCPAQGGRPLLGAGLLGVARAQRQEGTGLWDAGPRHPPPPRPPPVSLGRGKAGACRQTPLPLPLLRLLDTGSEPRGGPAGTAVGDADHPGSATHRPPARTHRRQRGLWGTHTYLL